ncbi:MAG: anti-sigma factor family protein [Pyrinomonadaceae bacterium]
MNLQISTSENTCPHFELAAYIDGELNGRDELMLEMHLAHCSTCASALNEQKKLLCFLDSAMLEKNEIDVPTNFAKIVVANAQGRVSGLRQPGERFRALFVCSGLFFLVLLGLGNETQAVVKTFIIFSEQLFAVGGFVWHFVYDFAFGLAIILRSLSSQFLFNSSTSFAFVIVLFLISLAFLSRLVLRFSRV